jgi:FkbM family methyltransferase
MTSTKQIAAGKLHATRTLYRMARHTANWREVWDAYRQGRAVSLVRLRNGLVIHHASGDIPHLLVHEVFGQKIYRCEPPAVGAVMVDLGANVGYASLFWLHRARRLQVHAYEPHPEAHAMLAKNLEANGYSATRVYCEAVGAAAGLAQLNATRPTVNSSFFAVDESRYRTQRVEVRVVGLSEALARVEPPDIWLLKIDIEGGEADALESVSRPELRRVRNVICEYHDALAPQARQRCEAVLRAAGFSVRVEPLDGSTGIIRARRGP